jgi:hypothetical protein
MLQRSQMSQPPITDPAAIAAYLNKTMDAKCSIGRFDLRRVYRLHSVIVTVRRVEMETAIWSLIDG